jgi:hypothetical protein
LLNCYGDGFVANSFRCNVNRKQWIEAVVIGKVLRLYQVRKLRRTCDCTGANVMVSQKLKSLRGIMVRNSGISETSFFVVCDDIWIAK